MAILVQICSTAAICFLTMIMGIMYTWPSSTLENFTSNQTVLDRPMEAYEVALFGSLSSIGALIGTPVFGYLVDKIGRKRCSILGGLPFLLAWSIIAAFNKIEVVLTALFFSGVGGASFVISPVFVSEICQDSIRGTVMAGSALFYNVGVLTSYILGGYLSYNVMVYSQITMSALYMVFICFLKESPIYLMTKGREEEAAKAIAFYRSVKPDSKEVIEELHNIKRILNPEHVGSPEEEKLKAGNIQEAPKENMSPIKFLWKTQSARRVLAVCLVMVTACIFMGLVVLQVYADPLFKEAVPSMSSTLCSIIFAVVTMIAVFISALLADRAGRRVLMIYSSGASAILTLILGTQLHLHWGPHALTAVLIYTFCFVFSIGAGIIPFILAAEAFLPEIKGFCMMIVLEWVWLCNFFILLVFNPLVDALGLGPVFYIFSVVCVCTTIFCYFFQPETKGLPVDVIQTLFVKEMKINNRILTKVS